MQTAARLFQVIVTLMSLQATDLVGVGSSQVTPCEGTGWPRSPQWPHASAELMLAAWQLPEARMAPQLAPAHKQASRLVTQPALWTVCRVVEGGRDWTATAFLFSNDALGEPSQMPNARADTPSLAAGPPGPPSGPQAIRCDSGCNIAQYSPATLQQKPTRTAGARSGLACTPALAEIGLCPPAWRASSSSACSAWNQQQTMLFQTWHLGLPTCTHDNGRRSLQQECTGAGCC